MAATMMFSTIYLAFLFLRFYNVITLLHMHKKGGSVINGVYTDRATQLLFKRSAKHMVSSEFKIKSAQISALFCKGCCKVRASTGVSTHLEIVATMRCRKGWSVCNCQE